MNTTTMPMKRTSGKLVTNPEDQLKLWFKFDAMHRNTEAPSLQEIETTIRSIEMNRAPKVDRKSAETRI